ncbi:FecR family protein [Alteriqipengyuania sp. 357]
MVSARRSSPAKAEAAAWQVRLDGEASPASRSAHRDWLGEDADHRAAFDQAEEIWAMLPRAAALAETDTLAASARDGVARKYARVAMALAACLALVVAISVTLSLQPGAERVLETQAGEQAVRELADGSTASLNTLTRLQVDYSDEQRTVVLEDGEAEFAVAHDAGRPFVVQAGDLRVRAVGTRFVVRRVGTDTSVTLIEGRISVSRLDGDGRMRPVPIAEGGTALRSGERLRLTTDGGVQSDVRAPEDVLAWRRGRVAFDDVPLGEAVAEINRYGGPRLAVGRDVAAIAISGSFSARSPAEFAQAVAALHGLDVRNSGQTLIIERPAS